MATSAQSAHGTFLKAGDGETSETFTTIAEVMDIDFGGTTVDTVEVTNHDSGGWKEYVATLKDGAEVTFSLNYTGDTTQDSLRTDQTNRTKRNFQLVLPFSSPETWAFAAYVTTISLGAPVNGVLTNDVTLKITGAVTVS